MLQVYCSKKVRPERAKTSGAHRLVLIAQDFGLGKDVEGGVQDVVGNMMIRHIRIELADFLESFVVDAAVGSPYSRAAVQHSRQPNSRVMCIQIDFHHARTAV